MLAHKQIQWQGFRHALADEERPVEPASASFFPVRDRGRRIQSPSTESHQILEFRPDFRRTQVSPPIKPAPAQARGRIPILFDVQRPRRSSVGKLHALYFSGVAALEHGAALLRRVQCVHPVQSGFAQQFVPAGGNDDLLA